jgi:hypothetical protein
MKKAVLAIILLSSSVLLFAQSTNDRRGYQGTVTANTKQTVRSGGVDEAQVKTAIQFSGRTITIEGDTYEIVKKAFDGKNKTTFTCTKRRGTFEITYATGESISVVDTSNQETEIIYKSLSEK